MQRLRALCWVIVSLCLKGALCAATSLTGLPSEWGIGQFETAIPDARPIVLNQAHHLAHDDRFQPWAGPEAFAARITPAWNAAGLLLRFQVTDREVVNEKSPELFWQQDCVEVFLAPPAGQNFGTAERPVRQVQILLAPPVDGRSPYYIYCQYPNAVPLQTAGRRTADGYEIDLWIPRQFFGDFAWAAGNELKLQFAIDDYNRADADRVQPRILSVNAARELAASPIHYLPFQLSTTGDIGSLDPYWFVKSTAVTTGRELELALKNDFDADCIRLQLLRGDQVLCEQEFPGDVAAATVPLPGELPDGNYTVVLEPWRAGRPQGTIRRSFTLLAGTVQRIGRLDWGDLAAREPWRAVNWLAVVSTVEFIKSASDFQSTPALEQRGLLELAGRLALLHDQPLPPEVQADEQLRLLELLRGFQAQIAVEFSRSNREFLTTVVIPWGDFPLINADIRSYATPEEAQRVFDRLRVLQSAVEPVTVVGADVALLGDGHLFGDALRPDLEPEYTVTYETIYQPGSGFRFSFPGDGLPLPQAVIVLDNTPEAMRRAVLEYAAARQLPLIAPEERGRYELVMIAGTPDWLKNFWQSIFGIPTKSLILRRGNLVIQTDGNQRELGLKFARFLLDGQPLTAALAEELRRLRAAGLDQSWSADAAAAAAAETAAADLWVGDVHTHTIYSDGSCTPAGLIAEAPYAGLDFVVISDHNYTVGAELVQANAAASQYRFPVVVGEEITMSAKYHLNLYPLRTAIDCNLPYETILAQAHEQGAVAQWNHPLGYGRALNRYWHTDLSGSGLDAVERNLEHYKRWEAAGKLPVYTGSTDTHMGIFGHLGSTVIRVKEFSGAALAEAVRTRQAAMINPRLPEYVYGDIPMRAAVRAALHAPAATRDRFQNRLIRILTGANLAKLIEDSASNHTYPAYFTLVDPAQDQW